jgi:hypothetical protein
MPFNNSEEIMVAKQWISFAAPLAIVGLMQGCASTSSPSAGYVSPPLGSTWTFVRRDAGSFGSTSTQLSIKRATQSWQGTEYIALESSEQTILATPSGWIGFFRDGKPLVTWDPPLGFQWPISVGKSWTTTHSQSIPGMPQKQTLELKVAVEAYEDVVVPAGSFKTFRMKIADNMGAENVVWYSPDLGIFVKQNQRRTDKHQQGPGTRDIEVVSQTIRK